jgi:hypothetical protein
VTMDVTVLTGFLQIFVVIVFLCIIADLHQPKRNTVMCMDSKSKSMLNRAVMYNT